jgi:hypothetical protein
MRCSPLLLAVAILAASGPALAEQGNDAPGVTVLRGASAPPPVPAAESQVVVQTVVYPEIVYVPAYYPAYSVYPGYVIQPRRFMHQQVSVTGPPHSRMK